MLGPAGIALVSIFSAAAGGSITLLLLDQPDPPAPAEGWVQRAVDLEHTVEQAHEAAQRAAEQTPDLPPATNPVTSRHVYAELRTRLHEVEDILAEALPEQPEHGGTNGDGGRGP